MPTFSSFQLFSALDDAFNNDVLGHSDGKICIEVPVFNETVKSWIQWWIDDFNHLPQSYLCEFVLHRDNNIVLYCWISHRRRHASECDEYDEIEYGNEENEEENSDTE